jgi:hypothetical protein
MMSFPPHFLAEFINQNQGDFMPRKNEKPTETADTQAAAEGAGRPEARDWGNPYKTIFLSKEKGFEMGENRRFKQRVFLFQERPGEEILARLKESGFTYRAGEKAWTIQADADTRKLSDELAREFAGQTVAMSR